MKSKKLLIASSVVALALTTSLIAYAATTPAENAAAAPKESSPVYEDEISLNGEGAISFEHIEDLPDGVYYQEEVSQDVEGAVAYSLVQ